MAEYIEREAYVDLFNGEHNLYSWEEIEEFMDSIHAADVQPVKHGKWEEVHEWMGDVEYSCSVCGCYALWKELTTDQVCTEYCPYCGAKMDGET